MQFAKAVPIVFRVGDCLLVVFDVVKLSIDKKRQCDLYARISSLGHLYVDYFDGLFVSPLIFFLYPCRGVRSEAF